MATKTLSVTRTHSATRAGAQAPTVPPLSPTIAAAMRRLEQAARGQRGWLSPRDHAPGSAIRHAEALAADAAAAGRQTMACLSAALARSLRRGGGQAALASYVAAIHEAALISPDAERDPAREAMAAMVAQRLGG